VKLLTHSFHLKTIVHSGLANMKRESRNMWNKANIPLMRETIAHLTAECCSGNPTPEILDAADDILVCYCAKVDKKTILDAVAAGYDTVDKLKAATGICPEDHDCKTNNPSGRCCLAVVNALLRAHAGALPT